MSLPASRAPQPLVTAYTISIGEPQAMASAAKAAAARPLLKIKLGGAQGDAERIAAVRAAAPQSELIVDANEGWSAGNLAENLAACAAAGVTLIEQPLPADADAALATIQRPIPICADESVHDRATLARAWPAATTPSTSSSTRPAASPRRWRWRTKRRASACRS